jgi:hypothetical protein
MVFALVFVWVEYALLVSLAGGPLASLFARLFWLLLLLLLCESLRSCKGFRDMAGTSDMISTAEVVP